MQQQKPTKSKKIEQYNFENFRLIIVSIGYCLVVNTQLLLNNEKIIQMWLFKDDKY